MYGSYGDITGHREGPFPHENGWEPLSQGSKWLNKEGGGKNVGGVTLYDTLFDRYVALSALDIEAIQKTWCVYDVDVPC